MSIITCHDNKLAVDVKDHYVYTTDPRFTDYLDDEKVFESVYEQVIESFWWVYAPKIAREFGYGKVYSEGRSDGWLVVENPPELDIDELEESGLSAAAAAKKAEINMEEWLEFQSRIKAEMIHCREDIIVLIDEIRAEQRREEQEMRSMECRDIQTVDG